jgi:hypothetical protein
MLKDLEERYTRNINGKIKRVYLKYKETKEDANKCADKCKKAKYHYRIEPVTDKMRNNHWAGVPHGSKYMVTYWR